MNEDILTIQNEEDGTYTYAMPELGIVDNVNGAQEAVNAAIERIKIAIEKPSERKLEIQARLSELQTEHERLNAELVGLQTAHSGVPIEAVELLEQIPMLERYIRWFVIDHPIEQIFGDVQCIGFVLGRDKDQDGDPDCDVVLHSSRKIK